MASDSPVNLMRSEITSAEILVVKVGSSLLIKGNELNRDWLAALAADLAQARQRGQKIVIVSSGAVALGCAALGLNRAELTLEQSQAAAATGQIDLAHGWKEVLEPLGLSAAQVLLTPEDTEQRRRYLNARGTLQSLLDLGVIPIINENDTVATQELRYGDNDRLAARVASMISADCLLLFSDVAGFYTAAPDQDASATLISEITEIDETVTAMAGGSASDYGSGGMVTKLEAARITMQSGCHMILADGRMLSPLTALANGAESTLFRSHENPLSARQSWIGGTLQPSGSVHIDAGANTALRDGKSLLPIGVARIEGTFERGDCVAILDPDGNDIGRGLIAYSHQDAARICGQRSSDIATLLGYSGRSEMVHRDDMVMTQIANNGK